MNDDDTTKVRWGWSAFSHVAVNRHQSLPRVARQTHNNATSGAFPRRIFDALHVLMRLSFTLALCDLRDRASMVSRRQPAQCSDPKKHQDVKGEEVDCVRVSWEARARQWISNEGRKSFASSCNCYDLWSGWLLPCEPARTRPACVTLHSLSRSSLGRYLATVVALKVLNACCDS